MDESAIDIVDPSAGRRANAYYALARALEPPRIWGADLPELLAGALSDFQGPLPELGERLAGMVADAPAGREALSVAHAKLFLGPFEILAAPWASLYLEPEPKLMGAVSEYTARAYAEAALGPAEALKDVPDHVTHELEFMYFLAFNEATTGDSEWYHRQERFWREHLGCWLPDFAAAVASAEAHPFYGVLADAVSAFCLLEAETLGAAATDGEAASRDQQDQLQ